MENPFKFSGIVEELAFCNREEEQKTLLQYISGSQNILIYSHRRYGKSSLILKTFRALKNIKPIYVDLYGTTSTEEFISSLLKGLSSIESRMNHLVKIFREAIRSIGVRFSVDPVTGTPLVSPVFNRRAEDRTIDEIFAFLENLSKRKKMAVAFDEFQEIATYGGDAFEKILRKSMQNHQRISYIFCGSQRHLITEMFNNKKRAFYMLANSYPLEKIKTIHYVEWVNGLYRRAKRKIDNRYIEGVLEICENHPMYVQEFFFNLWPENELSFEILDRVEHDIVEKRIPEYSYLWDSLTLNQRRTLKLLSGTGGRNIFSAENMAQFGLRTASQVTAALANLEKAGLLDKNREWNIHDPIFKRWLTRQ